MYATYSSRTREASKADGERQLVTINEIHPLNASLPASGEGGGVKFRKRALHAVGERSES